MSVGIEITKASLDTAVGNAARMVHIGLSDLAEIKLWADAYSSPDLVTMFGYTQQEADYLKEGLAALAALRDIYLTGTPVGGDPGDYVLRARRLFGLGV